ATSPALVQDGFDAEVGEVFDLDEKQLDKLFSNDISRFGPELEKTVLRHYQQKRQAFGDDIMQKVESDIYLQVLDNLWMQHLENMDHLREGIHWISVGQRDPLVEYRRQGQ